MAEPVELMTAGVCLFLPTKVEARAMTTKPPKKAVRPFSSPDIVSSYFLAAVAAWVGTTGVGVFWLPVSTVMPVSSGVP